jgi:hypothetical protein
MEMRIQLSVMKREWLASVCSRTKVPYLAGAPRIYRFLCRG